MLTPAERRPSKGNQALIARHRESSAAPAPSRLELTSRSKESPIARLVAVWPPVVLGTSTGRGRGHSGPRDMLTGLFITGLRCKCAL